MHAALLAICLLCHIAIGWTRQIPLGVARPSRHEQTFRLVREVHHAAEPTLRPFSFHRDFPVVESATVPDPSLSDLKLKSTRQRLWRPRARGGSLAYFDARRAQMREARGQPQPPGYIAMGWDEIEVEGPDITDLETLASLAKMTSNAYVDRNDSTGWYEIGHRWNVTDSFGWETDGLRGHVFATRDNSTVIVAVKGTSAGGVIGGGGSTGHNDKRNDNLLFSCCCARVDWSWSTVCDCFQGGYKCGQTCVEDALIEDSVYYPLATDLYNNITRVYPHSNIWLTGHSLGGGLTSLLSLTFGVPAVTFEAPGDVLPARRLHLPLPPGRPANATFGAITHVYHNADPIPQGACTGFSSACSLAGFALESRCHTGQTIMYDAVGRLGWAVDIRTHSIAQIIDKLLIPDWDVEPSSSNPHRWWKPLSLFPWPRRGKKGGDGETEPEEPTGQIPRAQSEEDCLDCFRWEYVNDFAERSARKGVRALA